MILSTTNPQDIRKEYGLITTPIVWISDEAFEDGVSPKNLKEMATVIINFMKQIEKGIILLDGIDPLISINGYDNVQHVVQTLITAAQTTNNIPNNSKRIWMKKNYTGWNRLTLTQVLKQGQRRNS